jgi:hypothetical protein
MEETQKIDPLYDFSDPRSIGPGAWHYMHVMAAWVEEEDQGTPRPLKVEIVCQLIERFCLYFKCGKCNGHCNHHVNVASPPRKAATTKYGLFNWTIDFRNAVNVRIGNPKKYDHKIMLKIFTTPTFMVCNEGCGSEDKVVPSVAPLSGPIDVFVKRDKDLKSFISQNPHLVQDVSQPRQASQLSYYSRGIRR